MGYHAHSFPFRQDLLAVKQSITPVSLLFSQPSLIKDNERLWYEIVLWPHELFSSNLSLLLSAQVRVFHMSEVMICKWQARKEKRFSSLFQSMLHLTQIVRLASTSSLVWCATLSLLFRSHPCISISRQPLVFAHSPSHLLPHGPRDSKPRLRQRTHTQPKHSHTNISKINQYCICRFDFNTKPECV